MQARWLLAVLLLAAGCATQPSPGLEVVQRVVALEDNVLGPGDTFEVRIYGEPDLPVKYQVSSEGNIDFPFLKQIKVDGLTAHEVNDLLTRKLGEKFIRNPQVTVLITDQASKKIILTGL